METVEAIERATLDAVPPQRLDAWDQWLLGLDTGTVGRAHSAPPLVHAPPRGDSLRELERRYAAAGLPTVLRLPDVRAFDGLRGELAQAGYVRSKPTLVQTAPMADAAGRPKASMGVDIATAPGADWEQVFLGEGFDPVDGASRLAILSRGTHSLFASVQREGHIVAVGAACLSHGWCGIHAMRTLPAWRGRGLATAIVGSLLAAARERAVDRVFLQVEEANAGARSLYAGLGFATAWGCAYWRRP